MSNRSYYRALPCDYFPEMQQQAVKWLLDKNLIHEQYRNSTTILAVNELITNVPTINKLVTDLGLTIHLASVHRTIKSFDFEINDTMHVDYSRQYSAIEIPVIGYQHSERVFYRAKVTGLKTTVNDLRYWECDETTAQEVDRVQINGPTVITINQPSKIELHRTFINRISIVVRTTPDAVNLL